MQIFPAIDLKDKQVVRLTQGDYGKVEVYGQDPAAAARGFAAQGAKYLHVVDLDGAKDGALSNFDAVSAIIAATGMFVEVGGGIRDEARVRAYLEQGAGRVILGTIAAFVPIVRSGRAERDIHRYRPGRRDAGYEPARV